MNKEQALMAAKFFSDIADGKTRQRLKSDGTWEDVEESAMNDMRYFFINNRIKPEPREWYVALDDFGQIRGSRSTTLPESGFLCGAQNLKRSDITSAIKVREVLE